VAKYIETQLVSDQKVVVQVSNPELVQSGNIIKGKFTVFTISTQPFGWEVKRRYSDFEWLHKCLVKRFSAHYVFALN